MSNSFILIYLLLINVISGFFFAYDKYAAVASFRRVPERTLHLFELLGGVFANLFFMFILRHKIRKSSYYKWTWLIFTAWLFIILMIN